MNNTLKPSRRPTPSRKRLGTKHDIAILPQQQIRRMSHEELVVLIRLADVPLFRERVNDHLPDQDRPTLERLAFLAQRTVQNQNY